MVTRDRAWAVIEKASHENYCCRFKVGQLVRNVSGLLIRRNATQSVAYKDLAGLDVK